MSYFFDSSALVKRYVQEIGSAWVRSLDFRDTTRRNVYRQNYRSRGRRGLGA